MGTHAAMGTARAPAGVGTRAPQLHTREPSPHRSIIHSLLAHS